MVTQRICRPYKNFYRKPVFWHLAYYVGSVGNVTLETIRRYVDQQDTQEKLAKSKPKPSLDPPPGASLLAGGMSGHQFIVANLACVFS
jgi:hypothetical protein